jgi:nucleoside-diphosphate-sugar epimerase
MNRTVAVTGGSGKLGRAVVAALIVEGWTVVNFDRVPSPDSRAHFIRTDFTDYGQVVEALSGIDEVHSGVHAVVHLAAIPGATFAPNVATFDNNLVSTFHIFQAAKPSGRRVQALRGWLRQGTVAAPAYRASGLRRRRVSKRTSGYCAAGPSRSVAGIPVR